MQDREMPLEDHLEELRRRLALSLVAVGLCFGVGFFVSRPILNWFITQSPVHHVIVTGVTEAFFGIVKVDAFLSVAAASPVWLYQAAAFVLPGLTPAERRVVGAVVGPGVLLFAAGAAAGLFWFVPVVLRVMLSFTGGPVTAMWTLGKYLGFIFGLMIPFGLLAELPLVAGVLAHFGLLPPEVLGRGRRYAVLAAFVVAAILAPPDALSMVVVAIPLYLLYEVAVLVARWFYRPPADASAAAGPPARVGGDPPP